MHLNDLTAALAARDMGAIKEAFLVLANYPEGGVTGLAAHNAVTFFLAITLNGQFGRIVCSSAEPDLHLERERSPHQT
jgi:hypothetical protein